MYIYIYIHTYIHTYIYIYIYIHMLHVYIYIYISWLTGHGCSKVTYDNLGEEVVSTADTVVMKLSQ